MAWSRIRFTCVRAAGEKNLELRPLPGPLAIEEYDALFAKPSSAVYRTRVAAGVGPDFRANSGK